MADYGTASIMPSQQVVTKSVNTTTVVVVPIQFGVAEIMPVQSIPCSDIPLVGQIWPRSLPINSP